MSPRRTPRPSFGIASVRNLPGRGSLTNSLGRTLQLARAERVGARDSRPRNPHASQPHASIPPRQSQQNEEQS